MNTRKTTKPGSESLSELVQRVMRQHELSIRDVQERAGGEGKIAASYISRIINGQVRNLSVDKIAILAEGLGVDAFEVFAASYGKQLRAARGGIDPFLLLDTMQQMLRNPDALEVVQRWLRLSPEHRISVLNWIGRLSVESKPAKKKNRQKKR